MPVNEPGNGMEPAKESRNGREPGDSAISAPGEDSWGNLLSEHKGKLTLGVAATLGLMVFYNWREKRMAKEDPEAYAQLQKFTAPFKSPEEMEQQEFERKLIEQQEAERLDPRKSGTSPR